MAAERLEKVDAMYVCDGLAKRRKMTDAGGNDSWWRWDGGGVQAAYGEGAGAWDVGTRNTTYIGKLADAAGGGSAPGRLPPSFSSLSNAPLWALAPG